MTVQTTGVDVKSFVVDRSRWFRGYHPEIDDPVSALVVNAPKGSPYAGHMCCLGHLGVACGVPEKAMLGVSLPRDLLSETLKNKFQKVLCEDTPDGSSRSVQGLAVRLNDMQELTDASREAKLTELFKSIGIRVRFTGPKLKERAKCSKHK